MTRKQFGLIFTLMLLVTCVGILAAKLNTEGLTEQPTDLADVLSQNDEALPEENKDKEEKNDSEDKETIGTQDTMYALRSERESLDSETIEGLNEIIEDSNTSQDKKDVATNELTEKTVTMDYENRIETNIKSKGFEDVLCFIEGNRARVFVKTEDKLVEEQTAQIQEIVEDVSSISDIIIEVKK